MNRRQQPIMHEFCNSLLRRICIVTAISFVAVTLPGPVLVTLTDGIGLGESGGGGPGRRCQEITVPMCRGIGYNLTYMPNQFSHDTQDEAGLEVHQFWPLVEIQCSPDLRFFLCSMYAPICMPNYQKPLPACRSVCERARDGCAPVMRQYGFAWPERMRCSDLPEYGDRHRLCMDVNSSAVASSSGSGGPKPPSRSGGAAAGEHWGLQPGATLFPPARSSPAPNTCPQCQCRSPLIEITDITNPLFGRVSTGGVANCAVPCEGVHFTDHDRKFARIWIGLWSSLCLVSTAMTLATFAVDRRRFRYPERAIVLLSSCYMFVAIGYIVGVLTDHESVSCDRFDDVSVTRYYSTGPVGCTAVFLLVYFFGMAACLWWVVLTFTWFLAAGLKWSHEAISANAQYFHFVAWMVPAVQSIAALAMSVLDGDPLSGICYVGNHDLTSLRAFVIGPLCAYLLVGTCFLVIGFVATFRIRHAIRHQAVASSPNCSSSAANGVMVTPVSSDKLDRFMVRIGVVSVLYTVPASTVIACLLYEQHFRSAWEEALVCRNCDDSIIDAADSSSFELSSPPVNTVVGVAATGHGLRPDFSVFVLKYFACLVVGITSGFWIWTRKTVESWRARCCSGGKLCCCCGNGLRDSNGPVGTKMMAADGGVGCCDEAVALRGNHGNPVIVVGGNSGKTFPMGTCSPPGQFVCHPNSTGVKQLHSLPESSLLHQPLTATTLVVDGLKSPSFFGQL